MNIVLIQTDQQRRDSVGVYGNETVRTPTIDQLAREGVVFDYAFSPIPLCAPARASLLTGERPLSHGILFNREFNISGRCDFHSCDVTLPKILSSHGHLCTHVGKWHVGSDLTPHDCEFGGVHYPGYGYPDSHPHYLAYLDSVGADFVLRDRLYSRWPDGSDKYLLAAVQDGPEEASVPHYLTNLAIDAIRAAARTGSPFYLQLDFWEPHAPYILPRRYAEMYDPDTIEPWPNFADDMHGKPEIQRAYRRYWGIDRFSWDEWRRLVAMSYGSVTLLDDQVRRVIAALSEFGLRESTAVLFTSDHGGMVGAHGLEDKGPYLYDEVCRVPLVARVPGAAGGRRSDALVYNMDLMPTILELAGCGVPSELDAVSLLPVIRGQALSVRDAAEPVYAEFHGHQIPYEQRMVRTRDAKYVFNAGDIDELYDLKQDPGEMTNLVGAGGCEDLLSEMRLLLRAKLVDTRDPILAFFEGSRMAALAEDSPMRPTDTGRVVWDD